MCLQSWPRAGSVMRLNVMGQINETCLTLPEKWKKIRINDCDANGKRALNLQTLSDAWSVVGSLFSLVSVWLELKFRLILATHVSTDTKLRRNRPCSACRIVGRWTSCNTNKWDCNERKKNGPEKSITINSFEMWINIWLINLRNSTR